MARYLPSVIELAGYLSITAAAFLTDPRLGLAVLGACALYDARGAK